MIRWLSAVLCAMATVLAADAVQGRASHREAPLTTLRSVEVINWGGATSRGNIQISGLPRIQSARESARMPRARLRARKKDRRSAPGERINRPDFGAGNRGSSRATGRRVYKPIRIRKRVDAATPFIRRAYESKRRLPRVVIQGHDRRGELRALELERVMITSYSAPSSGPAANEVAMEEITLAVENIRMR